MRTLFLMLVLVPLCASLAAATCDPGGWGVHERGALVSASLGLGLGGALCGLVLAIVLGSAWASADDEAERRRAAREAATAEGKAGQDIASPPPSPEAIARREVAKRNARSTAAAGVVCLSLFGMLAALLTGNHAVLIGAGSLLLGSLVAFAAFVFGRSSHAP